MKEELRDEDGSPLFSARFAETVPVVLQEGELAAYQSVMEYAQSWYGENATLALSIYGKRAASCLPAVEATLRRRLDMLSGAAAKRGLGQVPDALAEGLRGERALSDAFEDPEDFALAEEAIVGAATRDKAGEVEAVQTVLAQVRAAIDRGGAPSKWTVAEELATRHSVHPGNGQLLVFTEFADTARWLAKKFADDGYTVETLEGAVDHKARHELQRRFLSGDFQILVSTDAGGEGINLQSAHVMIDWDIPWSLVRLEQRMGRLHRIGQKNDVYIYHLVAPETREGRVQEVMLGNLEAASESLGGRIFDLLDATVARSAPEFDFARALATAQAEPGARISIPDVATLKRACEALANEDKHLRTRVDQTAAAARFRADRLEAINPVIVDGFVDALARAQNWTVGPGPAQGIRRLHAAADTLPAILGGQTTRYVASDGGAVQQARADGAADLDDVIVLGPTEDAFVGLIDLAVEVGRPELLRGSRLIDTGSLTKYLLLVYEAEVRMYDGVHQVARPAPMLIRWSGAGAFEVAWESLMSLRAAVGPPGSKPTPAQLTDGELEAREALRREARRQKAERLGWVGKARSQLNDLEDRFLAEIAERPKAERQARLAAFKAVKNDRIAQLAELEDVQPTAVRLIGWANVGAGLTRDEVGYDPTAEKSAVAKVIAELEALSYNVDDRQTARVGYDLLARHRQSGEQRCVEVKGFIGPMGPVWLEQNEWAQALQRGDDYWLYVVDHCATQPTIEVRAKNPAKQFGDGAGSIQRFQIKLSQLKALSG